MLLLIMTMTSKPLNPFQRKKRKTNTTSGESSHNIEDFYHYPGIRYSSNPNTLHQNPPTQENPQEQEPQTMVATPKHRGHPLKNRLN
jgi:hypothetical protein